MLRLLAVIAMLALSACDSTGPSDEADILPDVSFSPAVNGDLWIPVGEYGLQVVMICAKLGVDPDVDLKVEHPVVQVLQAYYFKTGASCEDGRVVWRTEAFLQGQKEGVSNVTLELKVDRQVRSTFKVTVGPIGKG